MDKGYGHGPRKQSGRRDLRLVNHICTSHYILLETYNRMEQVGSEFFS